jgi:hypothetical protein
MRRRYPKQTVPIVRLLEARGFVLDARAIPRSVLTFRRQRYGATVELRFHMMRVNTAGIWREYPETRVGDALMVIRQL